MISGIDVTSTKEYTCKNDKTNPTTWIIGVLASRAFRALATNATVDNRSEILFQVVRCGLKGFKNFKVGEKEVEYKTVQDNILGIEMKLVEEGVMDCIPVNICLELATEILAHSKLSGKEIKN